MDYDCEEVENQVCLGFYKRTVTLTQGANSALCLGLLPPLSSPCIEFPRSSFDYPSPSSYYIMESVLDQDKGSICPSEGNMFDLHPISL